MRALVLVALLGCRKEAAPPPAPTPAAAPKQLDAAPIPEGVRFDCTGLLPTSGAGCAVQPDIPPAADALLEATQRLGAFQAAHHPPDDRWAFLQGAIDRAAAAPLAKLTPEVRVVLQNAALRIAIYAKTDKPALSSAALALAKTLALPAATLTAMGSEPTAMQSWLGASTGWKHRDRRGQLTLHASLHQGMQYFRPVLAGKTRAVFGQLIAIDREGGAHLTPVVGELEMRAGNDPTSAACVAEVVLVELACGGLPGLRVIEPATHVETHTVRRVSATELACNGCHTADTFPVLNDSSAIVADEITAALAEASRAIAALK